MDDRMRELMERRWAVVGFTHERAKEVIDEIVLSCGKEISVKINSKNETRIGFTDGTTLYHIRASDNLRGYKFGKMWCDKNIDRNILDYAIMPMYFGNINDIVWI